MKTSAQQTVIESLHTWYRNAIRNSKYRWLVVAGSLIYLLSPLDISPDVFPIIGWLDDGLIATLLVTEVSQMLFEHIGASRKKDDETMQETSTEATTQQVVEVEAVSVN